MNESNYKKALLALNSAQRQAVDSIDGPVLVIAGPGTGKTQLLTTRIAHILHETDTLPQNILCLTFTDAAAQTMRERLASLIGQAAYDVTISTYHAFGSELIRRHPDYFPEMNELEPADDLSIDRVLRDILAGLPFSNPLKFADTYLADIKTFISDAKRALLTPEDINKVAARNDAFIQKANKIAIQTLAGMLKIDKKASPLFTKLHDELDKLSTVSEPMPGITPLSTLLLHGLREANEHAAESGKTTELTKWKNAWLAKNEEGNFVLAAEKTTTKLRAAADIYKKYLTELTNRGLYDYDDMILRAVRSLEQHADFRYTLQEQYQYLLLDEFQDTNGAQLRLVELLTDNPASEGRPNVLAVGDDDQAIYAFQGANYSHMVQFKQLYRDVLTVALTENYRSHQDILQLALGISGQIEERLIADKPLEASGDIPKSIVERREAKSDVAQFAWVAGRIKALVSQGIPANEIAVLAPQHKHLEPLLPFLRQAGIPVRYEKRENILDDAKINQLLRMSELALALAAGKNKLANQLWSEVLSFEFWDLPTSQIWQLSWRAHDEHQDWAETLLQNDQLRPIALFFVRLSMIAGAETCETMLDYLIGSSPLNLEEPGHSPYTSPFYEYHFGTLVTNSGTNADFWDLLNNLVVLRARLRDYSRSEGERLLLKDFVGFVAAHRQADIKILNTNPHREADDAVHIMTAYKSKGQEFAAVFLLGVSDEVWGSKARTQSSRLSLPQNLQFMRYAGATNDERLRLFYVALTRAKSQLYLLDYAATFSGKNMTRLKYLNETTDESGTLVSPLLPANGQAILEAKQSDSLPTIELQAYWQQRHETGLSQAQLHSLLKHRVTNFRLSPTHVTSFIDLENQGPSYFFMNTVLRFPRAPIPTGEFGNAMHETLEWIHRHNKKTGNIPSADLVHKQFTNLIRHKTLNEQDYTLFLERGNLALNAYLQQRTHTIHPDNQSELNFRNEGVFIGKCWLNGHIDKLIVNRQDKTLTIVDYKTGKGFAKWEQKAKLHRYKLQLYLYKTLVEKSHTWAGYTVTDAYLEFIEPDETGIIHELHLTFDDQEQARANRLAERIWTHIQNLQILDTSKYSADLKGIEAFEAFLLQDEKDDPSGQTSLWS